MDREGGKMSEAKGPYKAGDRIDGHLVFPGDELVINAAHAAGVKSGRASRDGLRKALISISRNTCCEQCQQAKLVALAALEADGEGE
jgi:hypothetical protein